MFLTGIVLPATAGALVTAPVTVHHDRQARKETAVFRTIDETMAVAPQITAEDVAAAANAGYRVIVNNRPDGEDPGAPQGAEIEAAARAAGLRYVAIPVTHAGFSQPQVEAMAATLRDAGGPVLAYCRSGTRSANLWALARASMGDRADDLIGKAGGAGYDVSGLRATLDMLASK